MGLKIDGQHLNGVAPCYNPAHKHARPEESVEKLQDFCKALYEQAMAIDPEAVIEICPCGTSYAFHNMPAMNQTVASDPLSSWQVRHKGKTIKALMGPSACYAGDHVEMSDRASDFASTVGVGGIVSTKFTWPRDPKPKDSFLLTPDKEIEWRKWIALYNQKRLAQGQYLGGLYDIGFDKPEAHVVDEGRPALLRVLRRALERPGRTARARQRPLRGDRLLERQDHRLGVGRRQPAAGRVRALPPARSNAAPRSARVSVPGAVTHEATRPKAWLIYAFATTMLWGVWGAFAGISAERGFPETLVYCVWSLTMILPALYALSRTGWRLDRDPRAVMYGLIIGLTGAGGQMVLFYALTTGPAYLIFPLISLSPIVTIGCPICCSASGRTSSARSASCSRCWRCRCSISRPKGSARARASAGSCWR